MAASNDEVWDPTSPGTLSDPIGTYEQMRQYCPVAHSTFQGWTVFRYDAVETVIHDTARFSNNVSRHLSVPNGMDPPEHARFRELINPYFASAVIKRFDPDCRRIVAECLDAAGNGAVEIMADIARPFASRAQCAFLGWSEDLAPEMAAWVAANQKATLERNRPTLKCLA